jgi:hypothetical protein
MKKTLFKITAWLIFIWCVLLSLGVLSLIFVIFITIKDANIVKLILVDFILVVIAGIIFTVGLGVFEFVTSFLEVEKEIEKRESESMSKF